MNTQEKIIHLNAAWLNLLDVILEVLKVEEE
jgi:hypothetical protein